ncbi:glucosidase 2 subunit beta-like [Gigantopelta aegis]|uniref:glucosidase 2 subunit beta-like n=1 Tax=Gigantopelta aegis TaxID=1735272 RepID=UPI001B88A215|nr:glucosidase 2 subunit beta-like [Gigantopelta aegis]XP_041361723.1 glucosidase 2 subunit beta-like [Gigantopelta aegis]XP_041361724.1 glucosidase 2 subunit beta-like [Gigantopelta aegis]
MEDVMRGWKRSLLCGRKYQTLTIILVIVIIFYWFQFSSHKKINGWNRMQNKHVMFSHKHPNMDSTKLENLNLWTLKRLPRGVHSADANKYKTDDGVFRCVKSKQTIKAKYFNDDFCDCDDFTDEPGTSACPYSRFYCQFQLKNEDPQFVPSSRVNDGICDCCDGSDEWAGAVVPQNIKLPDERQGHPVFHAPCDDHCNRYTSLRSEELRIHREGHELKKGYIEAAQVLEESRRKDYGPSGEFYKLSLQCFKYHTSEYEYDVCPFKSVKQQKFPQASVSLGYIPKWHQVKHGDVQLIMGGGDSRVCPDMIPRETLIRFLCGLEDQILNIKEDTRCVYVVKFSTPAAC